MIGEATDCPVRIYALMHVHGDGRVVNRVTKGDIFATFEAAWEAKKESFSCCYVNEYELDYEGCYQLTLERVWTED